jgi:acetylornithine deacetylase/succinyl-diaminopimelate desuccinylase-like protein
MSVNVLATAREYATESEPWFRERLKMLVEHRTISPGKVNDDAIIAGAEAATALMADEGAKAELVPTAGTPGILGTYGHDEPRVRILIYNHFDVQPADPEGWGQEDPFEFQVDKHPKREFLYRGRGSTDDKGPALCALRAASYVASNGLPLEIQLLWETEEEIGSPNFGDILEAKKDAIKPDFVIVSDTVWPNPDRPAISTGLRGGLSVSMRLRTADKEAHSGMAGGVARNPLSELCLLAAAMKHATFWQDDVVPPSPQEVRDYLACGFDPEYFRGAYALEKMETDVPLEMMLALWSRPTCEILGLPGGYSGPGIKTAVPPDAELKLNFRLVPNQDPRKLEHRLRSFVADHNRDVEVEILGYFDPYLAPANGRFHDAISDGMEGAFGKKPVMIREGGSIGAVPMMAQGLGVPVHFLPLSLPDHGYHAPNEYFDWRQGRGGIEAYIRLFSELAR